MAAFQNDTGGQKRFFFFFVFSYFFDFGIKALVGRGTFGVNEYTNRILGIQLELISSVN